MSGVQVPPRLTKKSNFSLNPHVSSNDVTCVSLNVVASVL